MYGPAIVNSCGPRLAESFAWRHRTDFSLGLYLFQGLGPRGLGREMDERLNARLRQCVDLLGLALARTKSWAPAVVEIEHIDADALLRAFERSRAAWSDRAEELWSRVAEKRASAFEAGAAIRERLPARA